MYSRLLTNYLAVLGVLLTLVSCGYLDLLSVTCAEPVDDRYDANKHAKGFDPPELSDDSNYNFLVISDPHYYNDDPEYFKKIESKRAEYNIDFIVDCGDLTQAGLASQFDLVVNDMALSSVPVYSLIGNHDLFNNGYNVFKKKIGKSIYSFKFGDTLMVFLDTANGILGDKQKSWFKKILRKNSQENVFVFSHYSIIDSTLQSPTAMPYPEESYFFIDINAEYDVDYFVSGHLHKYDKRTMRGVNYLIVSNTASHDGAAILFKVRNHTITFEKVDAIIK